MISGNIVVLGENHCYFAKERTRILSSILVTSVLLLTPNIFLFGIFILQGFAALARHFAVRYRRHLIQPSLAIRRIAQRMQEVSK